MRQLSLPYRHQGFAGVLLPLLALAVIKSHSHRVYGGYVEEVDVEPLAAEQSSILITEVNVLSPDGDEMLSGRNVVIEGGRIVAVSREVVAVSDRVVIDGRGKFLLPGLIDAHVHLRKQPNDLLLYLANGVTHVRDLAGSKEDLALRASINSGRIGPKLTVASPMLFTAGPMKAAVHELFAPRQNVGDAAHADAVVEQLMADGYDAIKTYADLDIESYRAINRAAANAGIHTVGHLPDGFSLEELATTQQRELAHIEELVKVLQDEFGAQSSAEYGDAFPAFVASRADAIVDALLANQLWVTSTLHFSQVVGDQVFHLEDALRRVPLEYANPAMVEGSPYVASMGWLPETNQFRGAEDTDPQARARIERNWAARAKAHRILCRKMVARGVPVIAGTDATSHLIIPGFSMHDELTALTHCGMTPAAALRAATYLPAKLMASDDGIIEPGRRANLVLLNRNPLVDIDNTRAIEAVIVDGRYLSRIHLDRMLDAVRLAHANSRKFDISAYQ